VSKIPKIHKLVLVQVLQTFAELIITAYRVQFFLETAINGIIAFYSRDAQGSPLAVIHEKILHSCSEL